MALQPGVPRGLSDIILHLMAKAPEQRYQGAEGLLHDLERLRQALAEGRADTFTPGERDFPMRLAPSALVGRDAELAVLRGALADALRSPRRTVLIEGAAGVGKTALINELRPLVTQAGGWLIHGKFDQYQREGATSGAVTQAARALGRLLLAQPWEAVTGLRKSIVDKLGRNAALMARLSPEFALLLGNQPDAPDIDPQQAEVHMQQATLELLGVIASPERPLVIVMDDLQWAGALSLRGIGRLITEPSMRGVLLVGAWRTEEVDAGHVLTPMLEQWRQLVQPPLQIALAPLTPPGMGELVSQMLRLAPAPASELAAAVGQLTSGNPFDMVEMINALRRDGALRMDETGWHWDETDIRRFVGQGSVMDLLAARIARLPEASRELLEIMSCLGNEVERRLLRAATGLAEPELLERLRAPLEDGLLLVAHDGGKDSVRFRHDRVQQAVLVAMDDNRRGLRQLAMARCLADVQNYAQQGGHAFESDAAQQYLPCVGMIEDIEEQRRAAQLFLRLARKLTGTATTMLAERYLASAGSLMGSSNDPTDSALRGAIDLARHAALYGLGRLEHCDPLYASLRLRTADPLDVVEPTCLQMRSLYMRGKTGEAKALGLDLLVQLGLHVPPDYAVPDMEQRLDALAGWIEHDSQLDPATRAQIRDPRLLV